MRIALFGASGTIGRRIAQEALDRGHTVTAIVRHPDGLDLRHEHLTAVAGDVTDPASVAQAVAGPDAAGQSRISAEDYAVALLDEVETSRFIRRRFTAAY